MSARGESNATTQAQQEARKTTMRMFLVRAFERIQSAASRSKHAALRHACEATLKAVKRILPTEQSATASAPRDLTRREMDELSNTLVHALRLACESRHSRIMSTALDCVQKLALYGYLRGSTVDTNQPSGSPKKQLMESVIDMIGKCFDFPDDHVQLQIIKAFLACITTPRCEIHEDTLMTAVGTCYNIYLMSRNKVNQTTAKASLTQILHFIFNNLEMAMLEEAEATALPKTKAINKQESSDELLTQSRSPTPSPVVSFLANINEEDPTPPSGHSSADEAETTPEEHSNDDLSSSTEANTNTADSGEATEDADNSEAFESSANTLTTVASESPASSSADETPAAAPTRSPSGGSLPMAQTVSRTPRPAQAGVRDAVRLDSRIAYLDCLAVFRALCKLSTKKVKEGTAVDSLDMRSKVLALELLLSILENSGVGLQRHERFIHTAIRKYLCVSVLATNGISSVPRVFRLSLLIFSALIHKFRDHLKNEVGIFFERIFLRILESSNSTIRQKWLVLDALLDVCHNPEILVELFLNYDCDADDPRDIYERMVNDLSGIAKGVNEGDHWTTPEEEMAVKIKALDCLTTVMNSLVEWSKELREQESSGDQTFLDEDGQRADDASEQAGSASSESAADQFTKQLTRNQQLKEAKQLFERHPRRGMSTMIELKLVENTPEAVASFLVSSSGLSKEGVGEYLGLRDKKDQDWHRRVLQSYVDQFEFTGTIDESLREFLSRFRLPKEAQMIDRIMESFAGKYYNDNPGGYFANADAAYVLAFGIIMLATDLHSPEIKIKITEDEMIRNWRGINDGADFPTDFLRGIYARMLATPLRVTDDPKAVHAAQHLSHVLPPRQRQILFHQEAQGMLQASRAELREKMRNQYQYFKSKNVQHVRPMFEVSWCGMLAAFSYMLESSDEARAIQLCLEGFKAAIRVSSIFFLETERNAFVNSLHKFTELKVDVPISRKNIECTKALLMLAHTDGNYLRDSWKQVLLCASELERLQLVAHGVRQSSFAISARQRAAHRGPQQAVARRSASSVSLSDSKRGSGAATGGAASAATGGAASRPHSSDSSPAVTGFAGSARHGALPPPKVLPGASSNPQLAAEAQAAQAQAQAERTNYEDENARILCQQVDPNVIDLLFSETKRLNGDAIVEFVRCLCAVSEREIEGNPPRIFSLQKIVENAHFNLGRIRLVWNRIWHHLQQHFRKVGCNENLDIAMYAVDSLRQLSRKFLQKDELANFNFQRSFLKPFEEIFKKNRARRQIRELVVSCLSQLIQDRAANIRSGWKNVFEVFSAAANDASEQIVSLSFEMTRRVVADHHALVFEQFFVETVNCLGEFANNRLLKDVCLKAVLLLGECGDHLAQGRVPLLERKRIAADGSLSPARPRARSRPPAPAAAESTAAAPAATSVVVVVAATAAATTAAAAAGDAPTTEWPLFTDSKAHMGVWFPLLTALSRVVLHPHVDVRTTALQQLFQVLRSYGERFTVELWELVFRGVLLPIFDNVRYAGDQHVLKEDNEWLVSTCLDALSKLIELFGHYFDVLAFLLSEHLALLASCILQDSESLANIGCDCLLRLVLENDERWTAPMWDQILQAYEHLLKCNSPPSALTAAAAPDSHPVLASIFEPRPSDAAAAAESNGSLLSQDACPKASASGATEATPPADPVDAVASPSLQTKLNRSTSSTAKSTPPSNAILEGKCHVQLALVRSLDKILDGRAYGRLQRPHLYKLLDILERTYTEVHATNRDGELWSRPMHQPIREQFIKQEVLTLRSFVALLLRMYADPQLEEEQRVEERLIMLYAEVCSCFVVDGADDALPPHQRQLHSTQTTNINQLLNGVLAFRPEQFSKHLSVLYPLLVQLVMAESREIRTTLVKVMNRVGVDFLSLDLS